MIGAAKLPASVPFGRLAELRLAEHPLADRIGLDYGRGVFSDVRVKVFSSRETLARCIRMQERARPVADWRAVVKLRDGEGY